MRNVFNLFSSFPFSFVFHFVVHNIVSNLLNKNGVRENPMSTTDEHGEKNDPLHILSSIGHCLYQRMSNVHVPLAYV